MNHSIPAAIAMLGLVLCAVQPSGAQAGDMALPNHPPLLSPDEDRGIVAGLPPGESRVWEKRVFSDGATTALCAEDLTLQPIYPSLAPARREGVLCLADIMVLGPQERTATVYLSGRLTGGSRALVVQPDCHIFVGDGYMPGPEIDHENDPPYEHVLTCASGDTLPAVLGRFLTPRLEEGTSVELSDPGIYLMLRPLPAGGGACSGGCDPVLRELPRLIRPAGPCEWPGETVRSFAGGHRYPGRILGLVGLGVAGRRKLVS